MRFTRHEKKGLLKSWLILSLAFTILISDWPLNLLKLSLGFVTALFTVGLGFILHEMAHKYLANSYGCHAEFRENDTMLLLALVTSFFRIIIAAPGAVHISGYASNEQHGKIAFVGPAANLLLSGIFFILFIFVQSTQHWLMNAFIFGAVINAWLGLFNLLPFGIFDGAKILRWSKSAYSIILIVAVLLSFYTASMYPALL